MFDRISRACAHLNAAVAASWFGRLFRLEGSGHPDEIKNARFLTEIRAGITTFATMAYVISVNATIIMNSGGPCKCDRTEDNRDCSNDFYYVVCLEGVKRDMVTATAAISALSSIAFGLLTNLPVALAPGMGLNAYFAYQVVGFHGTGPVPYEMALTAVFVEGFIFVGLSLCGIRQWLVQLIPTSLKIASACGIGLYLAFIGLTYEGGIGVVTSGHNAPTGLAGCPEQFIDTVTLECTSHKMTNVSLWIALFFGGVLTVLLLAYRVKCAMLVGISLVAIMSWPRDTSFTYFPHTPEGDLKFEFFKKVFRFWPIQGTLNALQWDIADKPHEFLLALFTFLYIDIIDTTATLYSMARFANVHATGEEEEDSGDFARSTLAYCTDAMSISIGALFGSSPVTAYIESAAGIHDGGKTGLMAVVTGLCFFVTLFFAPIFASIPPWATGCTLVIVGTMMIRQISAINWNYIGDAVPAFVTIMFIPFSYSTAYGLIAGILVYVAINVPIYIIKLVSRGRIVPKEYDVKEAWSVHPKGESPWFLKLGMWVGRATCGKTTPTTNRSSGDDTSSRAGLEGELKSRGDSHVIEIHDQDYQGESNVERPRRSYYSSGKESRTTAESPDFYMAEDGFVRRTYKMKTNPRHNN